MRVSAVCLFAGGFFLPAFLLMGGHRRFASTGTLLGFVIACACTWAFLACPRRPAGAKALTFALLLPALGIGVFCLADYGMSFLSQNEAVA